LPPIPGVHKVTAPVPVRLLIQMEDTAFTPFRPVLDWYNVAEAVAVSVEAFVPLNGSAIPEVTDMAVFVHAAFVNVLLYVSRLFGA